MALLLEIQFLHLEALLQTQELHKTTEVLSLELRNQEVLALLELIPAHLVQITTTIHQALEAALNLHQEAVVLLQDIAEVVLAEVVEVLDKKFNL